MSHHFFFNTVLSAPAGATTFKPGNYTIIGMYSNVANAQANYLMDATAEGYAASADFVIVMRSGNAAGSGFNTPVIFDCQQDGGSGTLGAADTGDNVAGRAIHVVGNNEIIMLPGSLLATAQATRHGRILGAASTITHFIFCSWN